MATIERSVKHNKGLGCWKKAKLVAAKPKLQYGIPNIPSSKKPAQIKPIQTSSDRYKEQVKTNHMALEINPNNMYWPPYNPLADEGNKEIEVEYITPITQLAVLSPEEAYELLQHLYDDIGGKNTTDIGIDVHDLTKNTLEAKRIAIGLGSLNVQSYVKNIHGKDWVIIKNYRKHAKTLLKGNIWRANNPKIVEMGLGLHDIKGVARFVRFNAGLEIAFATGINAVDFILRDKVTLSEFLGNSAGDIIKGFASLAGAAALVAIFPLTLGVLGSGVLFAVTSFLMSRGLDYIDAKEGYSESLGNGISEYSEGLTNAVEEFFK